MERRIRDFDTGENYYQDVFDSQTGSGFMDVLSNIGAKLTGETAKKLASKATEKIVEKGSEKIGEKTGELIGEKIYDKFKTKKPKKGSENIKYNPEIIDLPVFLPQAGENKGGEIIKHLKKMINILILKKFIKICLNKKKNI